MEKCGPCTLMVCTGNLVAYNQGIRYGVLRDRVSERVVDSGVTSVTSVTYTTPYTTPTPGLPLGTYATTTMYMVEYIPEPARCQN